MSSPKLQIIVNAFGNLEPELREEALTLLNDLLRGFDGSGHPLDETAKDLTMNLLSEILFPEPPAEPQI